MNAIFTHSQKQQALRIGIALLVFLVTLTLTDFGITSLIVGKSYHLYLEFLLFFISYLIVGVDVLKDAWHNICKGKLFDESFLMCVATIGAFALIMFPNSNPHMAEGAAVMIFFQIGESFESYAVAKSRKSIANMMDIAPSYANIRSGNNFIQVDPDSVAPDSLIYIKPGERVPIDGIVVEGSSSLDTSALTGESAPRNVQAGDSILSGCINLSGFIKIKTTKPYSNSTVAQILKLVEEAQAKKAQTENFITRFSHVYTPTVVAFAVLLSFIPPLFGAGPLAMWIERGLIFLVVSCPCALVISVPLSFFGGIGGASRRGILIKGGNYLEALSQVDTVVFDKTGTLTQGNFSVIDIILSNTSPMKKEELLHLAAQIEHFSNHPIAKSICSSYSGDYNEDLITSFKELTGQGVSATYNGKEYFIGNKNLIENLGLTATTNSINMNTTHIYVAQKFTKHLSAQLLGTLLLADAPKTDAKQTISELHNMGVKRCIMLTGDREPVAQFIAQQLGIDDFIAELLPQDKVTYLEKLLKNNKRKLAFVGDGLNDAPVLMRADVGIAMGAAGSDAAIEAADVVLMDDKPSDVTTAILISKKTMHIVWENIIFALGIKVLVLILAALGLANMWLAVFADVGVTILAVFNAMRAMHTTSL